jgi:D-aminoacyl-tRNA deacylase
MRALIQRVSEARVAVDGKVIGEIGPGMVVFVGIRKGDGPAEAARLAAKVMNLRIFPDNDGKMNLSIAAAAGSALIISQFTLYAGTEKGNRPSYTIAATPDVAMPLYEQFVEFCRESGITIATGQFRAHMKVQLVNDGPVTIICECES